MTELICPECKNKLDAVGSERLVCSAGHYALSKREGVWVDEGLAETSEKEFYDQIYENEHGRKWLQGLNRQSLAKRALEYMSLAYRRERFFKKNIKGSNNVILDLACGAGRDYFSNYGEVIGVDLSFRPLVLASKSYELVLQAGADRLPFADNTFDYVTSSDFFGHIELGQKDWLIQEILRVLKPGGKTLHVIETDSTNFWFRQAHKDPELFRKYFIEQIGGHVGLELPTDCVARWERNSFAVDKAEKIWGLVWPIRYYRDMLDNEYRQRDRVINAAVAVSSLLSRFKLVEVAVNVFLNPINSLVEKFFNLDNGQGLLLVCRKK